MAGKKDVSLLERSIEKAEKALEKLQDLHNAVCKRWAKGYARFRKVAMAIVDLKSTVTKKAAGLREFAKNWDELSVKLTRERDEKRAQIREKEAELAALHLNLAALKQRIDEQVRAEDEIVDQVFALHYRAVKALQDRNDYLAQHVYQLLIDDQGKLRSQITLDSSDGLRRVIAMTNAITKIRPDLASEALALIDRFFARFREQTEMDGATRALFELTKNILIEKTAFKVGAELYRFLNLKIDETVFPDLKKAQMLLRQSLRSEKTTRYARLFRRTSRTDNWEPVGLSD
jgi:hypothetical protein